MAAEVCSENWGWAASPRISFSHDLSQKDLSPPTAETRRLDSSLPLDSDFDFSVTCEISAEESSLADELFSHGILLPLPMKNSNAASQRPSTGDDHPAAAPVPLLDRQKRGSLREIMASSEEKKDDDDDERGVDKKSSAQHRPFWRFGRSISLGSGRQKAGVICPFPLSRSKSTGSNPNPNPNPKRRHFSKTTTISTSTGSRSSSSSSNNNNSSINSSVSFWKAPSDPNSRTYYYSSSKRGAYGSGMRISPVLNVPAPYVPRGNSVGNTSSSSSSFFGYLLCNCSNKSVKRTTVSCSP